MAETPRRANRAGYVPLRHRRESYAEELSFLGATYSNARLNPSGELRSAVESVLHLPTWYVGNGGTMAVAQYAAELHNERTGLPAAATTSLGFIGSRVSSHSALIVISAGAKHPDTAAVVQNALDRRLARIVVVTERERHELSKPFDSPSVEVVTLPRPGPKDGFLATNSVINISTAFAAAHVDGLPSRIRALEDGLDVRDLPVVEDMILLSSAGTWAAATDLETRLVETGLATVQKTDFRNFAHGRHLGLSRMVGDVAVVAMSDSTTSRLARATLDLLPREVPVIHLESSLESPASSLDLLVQSMHLVGAIADAADFDPARPNVPGFGRQLYRLDSRRHLPRSSVDMNIVRKLEAASLPATEKNVATAHQHRRRWLAQASRTPISSLVLDYDGTICATSERFEPPEERIQERILRLLDQGLVFGIASGRGGSLVETLQSWVSPELQERVYVAMYNGAICGRLDLPDLFGAQWEGPFTQSHLVKRLVLPLEKAVVRLEGSIQVRAHQVSIQGGLSGGAGPSLALIGAVQELITSYNATGDEQLKVVRSAHSIDVIPSRSSKNLLRGLIDGATGRVGRTLAIGDQGRLGGNDFELLGHDALTLSVDQVSGDMTRCWNLAGNSTTGPALLGRYLSAIKRDRSRTHLFRWE